MQIYKWTIPNCDVILVSAKSLEAAREKVIKYFAKYQYGKWHVNFINENMPDVILVSELCEVIQIPDY